MYFSMLQLIELYLALDSRMIKHYPDSIGLGRGLEIWQILAAGFSFK
jgi:hypothetical protein